LPESFFKAIKNLVLSRISWLLLKMGGGGLVNFKDMIKFVFDNPTKFMAGIVWSGQGSCYRIKKVKKLES